MPVPASPDGAEWDTATDPAGCKRCHLDSPDPIDNDAALAITGLPDAPEPGRQYRLTVVLSDPDLVTAGFLLRVRSDATEAGDAAAAGRLSPADDTTETREGTLARSTRAGSVPATAGEAAWSVDWTAPESTPSSIVFELWGNAGNDDLSPLGDHVHRRIWEIP